MLEALLLQPQHLHNLHSASGPKMAIESNLEFATCSFFTQFIETESQAVFSLTVKTHKPRIKSHGLLQTVLTLTTLVFSKQPAK